MGSEITIAALSLAAGQMGPRLLRNFTRDRGNQLTLGAFLGTFSYALMVLRSVRTQSEGAFVPHLSLSVGILLAFVCVATLVFFVGHMAGRINVDTVIDLVSEDVRRAIARLMQDAPGPPPPPDTYWRTATPVSDPRCGYLKQLDRTGLAEWAAEHATALRLLVRPGDYVFPGAAIRAATTVGGERVGDGDLEFALSQLVEVGVRALSPGINDPHTAMSGRLTLEREVGQSLLFLKKKKQKDFYPLEHVRRSRRSPDGSFFQERTTPHPGKACRLSRTPARSYRRRRTG